MVTATLDRPLLMSGPMVCKTLKGIKTKTRRVMKPEPHQIPGTDLFIWNRFAESTAEEMIADCPYGQVGARLWVRESWRVIGQSVGEWVMVEYCADNAISGLVSTKDHHPQAFTRRFGYDNSGKRPSIHMPRFLSRLTLEITSIGVERIQSLTKEEAVAEGFESIKDFANIWDLLNGPRGYRWSYNCWVWVIGFKQVTP